MLYFGYIQTRPGSLTPTLDWILNTPVIHPMQFAGQYGGPTIGRYRWFPVPRIYCKDGASLSVQCSEYTYCSPRDNQGPWDAAEVGFPNPYPDDPAWIEFGDGGDEDKKPDVYGWVPVELIYQHVLAHGGEDIPKIQAHAKQQHAVLWYDELPDPKKKDLDGDQIRTRSEDTGRGAP